MTPDEKLAEEYATKWNTRAYDIDAMTAADWEERDKRASCDGCSQNYKALKNAFLAGRESSRIPWKYPARGEMPEVDQHIIVVEFDAHEGRNFICSRTAYMQFLREWGRLARVDAWCYEHEFLPFMPEGGK